MRRSQRVQTVPPSERSFSTRHLAVRPPDAAPRASGAAALPTPESLAVWSEATASLKQLYAARPLGRRAAHIRSRRIIAEAKFSSGLERSDSFSKRHRAARPLGRRVARIRSRRIFAEAKVFSGLERSDRNKRKGRPATWTASSFQGRIVPTEVRKNHRNFLAKILRGAERQCQGISLE
jgi:hypothetical protein